MKKKFFLIVLLVAVWVCGCDDINFGVQELYNTYLILENVEDKNITVSCKSEKLNIPELVECEEVTSEKIIEYFKEQEVLKNDANFRFFYVPHTRIIHDHKNVLLYFEILMDDIIYKTELKIRTLNEKRKNTLEWVNFNLTEKINNNSIPAIFTFDLHISL